MATAIEEKPRTARTPLAPRPRVVMRGISWETYERLSSERDESTHVRMIYDRGRLEIVSPNPPHERFKYVVGRFIDNLLVGLRIPFEAACESRWTRAAAERGLESDEVFFIGFEKLAVVGGRPADRPDDPLPDLAVEIDTSEQAADRTAVYAALGVPELWAYDGEKLRISHLREDGTYEEVTASRFLPVSAEEITSWIEKAEGASLLEWTEELRAWVQDDLAPRVNRRDA